jgi:hypothetical protein
LKEEIWKNKTFGISSPLSSEVDAKECIGPTFSYCESIENVTLQDFHRKESHAIPPKNQQKPIVTVTQGKHIQGPKNSSLHSVP